MTQDQLEQGLIETRALQQQNALQISELSIAIKDIASELKARRGINWTAVGLIIPVVGGAWVLINTQISAVKESAGASEMRLQRVENVLDRGSDAKSKMLDTLLLDKLRERTN